MENKGYLERRQHCRTRLRVEGENIDPDFVSKIFGIDGERKERRNATNVVGMWRRSISGPRRITMEASEQLEYWCGFLEERQDRVRELHALGSQITIECDIWDPIVFFDLPADMMRRLGQLNVLVRFSIYDPTHPDLQPKQLKLDFFIRDVEWSDDVARYLLEQLYESRVARKIRAHLDAARGSFFALLPEGLEPQRVKHWADPMREVGYPQNPRALLYNIVGRFLRDPKSRVLGQEPDRPPEWPADYSTKNLVRHHDELGWELRGPSITESEIEDSLRGVSSLPYVLYFYRSDSPKRNSLDDRAVDEISENLVGLAVGALNEKTFLMWWRTDLMPFPGSDIARTV